MDRSDAFFPPKIERLVEGLPGTEFAPSYVFHANRSATGGIQAWIQESKLRLLKEKKKNEAKAEAKARKDAKQDAKDARRAQAAAKQAEAKAKQEQEKVSHCVIFLQQIPS